MQSHRGQVGIALEQLRDLIRERVQQARPVRTLLFRCARAAILVIRQDAAHTLAIDSQQTCDPALRGASVMQPHDLVARGLLHRGSSSLTKSWLSAATDPASRASL